MARLGTTGTTLTLIKVLRATSLASLGDFDPAAACLDEAAALADQTRRPYDIASLAYGAGYSALLRGRVADAIAKVEPAMDMAKSLDIVFFQPVLGNLLGQAYLAAGRVSDALVVLREAMRVVRGLGHVGGGGRLSIGLSLGGALLRSGEMDEAQGLIGACLDNARQQGYRGIHCNAARQMAALRAARGAEPNAIETLLSEAIDVATEIEARPSRAMAELALAEHLAKTGDRVAATALFGSVAAEFDAMGVIPMATRARQALAALG